MITLYSNRYNKKLINSTLAGYNDIFEESSYFRLNYNIIDDTEFKYYYIRANNILYYFKTEEDMTLFKLKYGI
jgi:hypothetical protein